MNLLKIFTPLVFLVLSLRPSPAEEDALQHRLSASPSRVFFSHLPSSVDRGRVRPRMVAGMVNRVVLALADERDIASAWKSFVKPGDRVGIKVSTSGAPVSSTHPAIVAAGAAGLEAAGVKSQDIVIWDRRASTMKRAGYEELGRRYLVISTEEAGGYSGEETMTAALIGKLIVGDREFVARPGQQTSNKSHLSLVVVGGLDKIIHLPVLTDSIFSGLQGALAGMVLDNIDNWRRLARPPHFGDPYLPELYSDPRLGGKVVLSIMDALRPQYAGGPFPGAQYRVNYGAIFASRDPVALDATGMRLLDQFRVQAHLPLLSDQTSWLSSAEILGLGHAREESVELIPVGPTP